MMMLATYVAGTFLCMSVESLMAYATPPREKGRAGGWLQTGNLGGGGVGGGAGVWIATHTDKIVAGSLLGSACLLCALALRFVHEPPRVRCEDRFIRELANVLKDLWQVARSRLGFLALLIFFLPIGTGAAGGLFSAIANDWYASADTVALVNGILGGLASAVGCIAGGYLFATESTARWRTAFTDCCRPLQRLRWRLHHEPHPCLSCSLWPTT